MKVLAETGKGDVSDSKPSYDEGRLNICMTPLADTTNVHIERERNASKITISLNDNKVLFNGPARASDGEE